MVPIPRIWSGNIARFASCLHGCMLQCRRQRQRVRHVAMVQPNRAMRGLFASKDRWLLAIGQSNPELQVKRLWTSTICRLDRSFGSWTTAAKTACTSPQHSGVRDQRWRDRSLLCPYARLLQRGYWFPRPLHRWFTCSSRDQDYKRDGHNCRSTNVLA